MTKKKVSPIKSYKLKNGDMRYEFPAYLGIDPLTGKQKRTMKRGFKTRKEAELALARIKLDVATVRINRNVLKLIKKYMTYG